MIANFDVVEGILVCNRINFQPMLLLKCKLRLQQFASQAVSVAPFKSLQLRLKFSL